jgi:phage baseplate assembly protein W
MEGKYLELTEYVAEEIRTNLIHLLLTRKGSRYFLPNFGTRLYEYIFQPMDGPTFSEIESEIRDSVQQFLPNLQITNIVIQAASDEAAGMTVTTAGNVVNPELSIPNQNVSEYTAKVRIDYAISNDVFNSKDFVIINI